jgi:hypothetical protein
MDILQTRNRFPAPVDPQSPVIKSSPIVTKNLSQLSDIIKSADKNDQKTFLDSLPVVEERSYSEEQSIQKLQKSF